MKSLQFFHFKSNILALAATLFFVYLLAACGGEAKTKTNVLVNSLSEEEQKSFKEEIIYYAGKSPVKNQKDSAFITAFKEHFQNEINKHTLEYYYKKNDSTAYFLLTRIAPSIKVKKVALGGKIIKNSKGEIVYYEEIFRTWKKVPEDLNPTMDFLFTEMVQEKDLRPYYPENSGDAEWIEFPNSDTYFDIDKRTWISTRINPLDTFYEAKKNRILDTLK